MCLRCRGEQWSSVCLQTSRYVSNGSRRGSFETSEDGAPRDVRVWSCSFSCRCFVILRWLLDGAGLIKPAWRKYIRILRLYISPSTKSLCGWSDLNEIWCVGRGQWVLPNGMPRDPIQGQGHKTSKLEILPFWILFPLSFKLGAGKWLVTLKLGGQCNLRLIGPNFWYLA